MSQRYQGGILGVGFNPLQAPNAPTIGTATAGVGSASVAFTAPANVGGSAISSYRVLANPGGIGATTASSPVTFSGLTNGTTYTFSVAAVNSYGFSPYSATATATPVTPIEEVFSTYLYTGNGATQTITNGINLSGQGGMVWGKKRSAAGNNWLNDSGRGAGNWLSSNTTGAQIGYGDMTFNSNGFTVANAAGGNLLNDNAATYASWTFREAPNFFDVVTYTGTGANRTIAHNLGVAPGMILVKRTDTAADWQVYHRSNANTQYMVLNSTAAVATGATRWNSTTPTSTEFTVGTDTTVNASGGTYVAYLFAHVTGSDGIIQCGSFTTDGAGNASVTLGWEPQWFFVKSTNQSYQWEIYDNMRGIGPPGTPMKVLDLNDSNTEFSATGMSINATGFATSSYWGSSTAMVYVAIRRGPMATPTLGTSVFNPIVRAGTGAAATVTTGNLPDWIIMKNFNGSAGNAYTRLTGNNRQLYTNSNLLQIDQGATYGVTGFLNTSYTLGLNANNENQSGTSIVNWAFSRAPGFMDVVCYTGTGSATTFNHNLGVVPELMFVKRRNTYGSWRVYTQATGANNELYLDYPDPSTANSSTWNNTQPTASVFTVGTNADTNTNSSTYINYLFASVPGVSKVGTYTGNGGSQTINCAFTTGARFVLIKRTSSNGDWLVWDSASGIVAGNDPYLALNNDAAQVTNEDSVDTDNTGFVVNQVYPSNINVNAATYIFLAIA